MAPVRRRTLGPRVAGAGGIGCEGGVAVGNGGEGVRRAVGVPRAAEAWWQWAASPGLGARAAQSEAPGWCLLLSAVAAGAVASRWSHAMGAAAALAVWGGGYGLAALLAWVGRELGGRASARALAASLAVASCPAVLALAAARLALWPLAAGLLLLAGVRGGVDVGRQHAFGGARVVATLVLTAVVAVAGLEALLVLAVVVHRVMG